MNIWRNLPVYSGADLGGGGGKPAAGDAAAAAAAGGTALERGAGGEDGDQGGGGGDGAARALTEENWRDFLAGDDADLKAELARSKTSKDFANRFKDMRTRIAKGSRDADPAPGDDKPDDLKKWREEHGVPLASTDYTTPEPIKAKITEIDKPIVNGYFEFMHKRNATQKEIDSGLEYYFGLQDAMQADRAEADNQNAANTEKTLRATFGADYRAASKIAGRAAKELIPGVDWFTARLPDGTRLGDIPAVVEFLHEQGVAKFGPGAYEEAEGGGGKGVDAEIATLKEKMKNQKAWRGDQAGQKRYAQLLEIQQKRKGTGDDE